MATSSTKSADAKRRNTETDAFALLTADHRTVKGLFKEFEKLSKQDDVDEEKAQLVRQICNELTVHAQVEEEIFYPALREAIDDEDLMDEADIEHASAKDLIAQISGMDPDDEMFDATVKVLGEYVDHHVKEEENEMFPALRKAELDLKELGSQLAERKFALMEEMGIEAEEPPAPSRKRSTGARAKASSRTSRQARAGSRSKSTRSSGRSARH